MEKKPENTDKWESAQDLLDQFSREMGMYDSKLLSEVISKAAQDRLCQMIELFQEHPSQPQQGVTGLDKAIQWCIENAFNVEGQDGTKYVAIDYEEFRTHFDEWKSPSLPPQEQKAEEDSDMLFHECPLCTCRCNCSDQPCSCCYVSPPQESRVKAEEFMKIYLGGNLNVGSLTPFGICEMMEAFANQSKQSVTDCNQLKEDKDLDEAIEMYNNREAIMPTDAIEFAAWCQQNSWIKYKDLDRWVCKSDKYHKGLKPMTGEELYEVFFREFIEKQGE